MNKLPNDKRAQIIGMMVKGMSIRASSRMTGASKNTLAKLLVEAVRRSRPTTMSMCNLKSKRLQLDEIWSFVDCKEENATPDKKAEGQGDIWTWTAIERRYEAHCFMDDWRP